MIPLRFFHAFIAIVFSALICANPSFCQGTAPATPPAYQALRFDEDWSYLKDSSRRKDFWDPLKYVALGQEGFYLTLGGEARLRYEGFGHNAFGAGPQDANGYLLHRYMFHSDLHLGKHVRVFAQLQSGLEAGRNGGPRPTDQDKLEFHQAFLDYRASKDARHSVTFRLGRQEFEFGSGRLFGASELLNVRRSFDGLRVTGQAGSWTFHSIVARPVELNPGFFDDSPDHSQTVWGAGAVHPVPYFKGGNFSLYYIGYDRKRGRFQAGTYREQRQTVGSRIFGKAGGFEYNDELVFQWGTFGPGPIRAWAVATDTSYVLSGARFSPQPGFRFDAASGDKSSQDNRLESFNPLFPSTAYSGKIGLLGPTNIVDFVPTFRLKPAKKVIVLCEFSFFWRQSVEDGIYGISVNLLKSSKLSKARYIANQPDLQIQYFLNRHLTLVGILTEFRAGDFILQTPPSKSIGYATVYATYRY